MAITVSVLNLPANAFVGDSISAVYSATGGTAPYTWSVSAGTLPESLSLDPSTGVLSGILTDAPGSFSWTVEATDAAAATGTLDSNLFLQSALNAPSQAVVMRNPIKWADDNCLPAGRQLVRLFYDAVAQPLFKTILQGNLQQPIGQIKTLFFSVVMRGVNINSGDMAGCELTVESGQTLQRIVIAPDPALVNPGGNTLCDFICNASVPFYVDDQSPVTITLGDEAGDAARMASCEVRMFFANFEAPAYWSAGIDNTSD